MDTTRSRRISKSSSTARRGVTAAVVGAALVTGLVVTGTARGASEVPDPIAPAATAAPTSTAVAAAPPTGVVTVDLTPSQQLAVDTAVAWYEAAGLRPPDITVRGGERETLCNGHWGVFTWNADFAEVRVCTKGGSWEQRVVVHELAHAWAHQHLSDATRDEFVALRGVDSWHDEADRWDLRGDEHAAEIIAWGVSEIPFPIVRIRNVSCAELVAAYETLTGLQPSEDKRCRPADGATTAP